MLLSILASGFVSEILILLAIILVVYIIFKLGKFILKLVFGIIANSIMGFVTILAANYFFGMGIKYTLGVLIATALFGLPAVGTLVVLKVFGAAI
ncbi:MAG: pro-sigmaK processing inhibitor BofA family protein [Candidatus Micrarchaeia archaeon]